LDTRTAFFYGVTGITPAMAMRMTGIGSQYLLAMVDADKNYFDGAKTYRVTLPKGIPLPARRQSELSVTGRQARRRRLDDHSLPRYSPQASSAATGFRRCRAKAGLRFFVSTAHSNHSLLRAGDPEKSRRLAWAAARCGIGDASTSSDLGQNRHCRLVPSVANRSTSDTSGPRTSVSTGTVDCSQRTR
jgi:hypothetical protein